MAHPAACLAALICLIYFLSPEFTRVHFAGLGSALHLHYIIIPIDLPGHEQLPLYRAFSLTTGSRGRTFRAFLADTLNLGRMCNENVLVSNLMFLCCYRGP